jgi:Zn-dependent oligopeptidase
MADSLTGLTTIDSKTFSDIQRKLSIINTTVLALAAQLNNERANNTDLKIQLRELKTENTRQLEQLRAYRNQAREWDTKVKQLEKNEFSLKEKLTNFKELANIVKNPKNADTIIELKAKLNEYIRFVEESIELLQTL